MVEDHRLTSGSNSLAKAFKKTRTNVAYNQAWALNKSQIHHKDLIS
jgi:hypothetical protein